MKRVFIDMDGSVARFHAKQNYLEEMYEETFFRNLDPYARIVAAIKKFAQKHPEVELCILSAYPLSSFAEKEKNEWLDEFLPIKERIFLKAGDKKSDYIPEISKDDYLLDDYTKNLLEWTDAGGTGIKVKNELNCRSGIWKGEKVDVFNSSDEIVQDLERILGLG